MPVVNQMSRLAGVVSRLELAADNLGAGIIDVPVKKYQNRDMLPLLVSRIEKAASFFDNKSVPSSFLHGPVPHPYRESKSTEPTAGERTARQRLEKPAENRAVFSELVSRFEKSTPGRKQAVSGVTTSNDGEKVENFDKIIKGKLEAFVDLSNQIGGEVKAQAHVVQNAFKAQRDFILKSTKTRRPNEEILAAFLRKTTQQMENVEDCRDRARDKQALNCLSAVCEGTGALAWVTAVGQPADFVKKKSDAARVHLDRVRRDFKDRKHEVWVQTFLGILEELHDYVRDVFPTGLTWGQQ